MRKYVPDSTTHTVLFTQNTVPSMFIQSIAGGDHSSPPRKAPVLQTILSDCAGWSADARWQHFMMIGCASSYLCITFAYIRTLSSALYLCTKTRYVGSEDSRCVDEGHRLDELNRCTHGRAHKERYRATTTGIICWSGRQEGKGVGRQTISTSQATFPLEPGLQRNSDTNGS